MTPSRTPGTRDILRAYSRGKWASELRGDWAIAVLYRLPGALLTALALRLGLPAWSLTATAAILTLALPMVALFVPLGTAIWAIWVMGMAVQVLDCADGDVARNSGTTSQRGKQIDFLADMGHWGMLYGAIGILADRHAGEIGLLTALALLAAWGRLFARVINDSVAQTGPASPKPGSSPGFSHGFSPVAIVAGFFSGLSGLIVFLALATPLGLVPVMLLLVYSALDIGNAAWRAGRNPPA